MEYFNQMLKFTFFRYYEYGYIITTDNFYQSKLTNSVGLIIKVCGNIESAHISTCNRKNSVP